jgi:hypothetical protein
MHVPHVPVQLRHGTRLWRSGFLLERRHECLDLLEDVARIADEQVMPPESSETRPRSANAANHLA